MPFIAAKSQYGSPWVLTGIPFVDIPGLLNALEARMPTVDLDLLVAASSAGGPSCLTSVTDLAPAGGWHTAIAPARFAPRRGDMATYAFEQRYLDGEPRQAVMVDSKQSTLNRNEAVVHQAIEDGHPVLSRLPRITVRYESGGRVEEYDDLRLPHRAFDGHIRAGTVDGVPTTDVPLYRTLRDAQPADARALMEASPVTLVFGGWDSSRASRQGRWRSALVGEIVGFCTEASARTSAMRGGARVDPVGMRVQVTGTALADMAEAQRGELSTKTYDGLLKSAAAAKKGTVSGSTLGLGGIPPTLDQLGGVACDRIVRSHVLSFATLRQMRFGAGPEGDAACRALLAAFALNALARSDAELFLRANCDLVEAGPTAVTMDQRGGDFLALDALGIEQADAVLAEALTRAEQLAGITWQGVVLRVEGNPAILVGAVDDEPKA